MFQIRLSIQRTQYWKGGSQVYVGDDVSEMMNEKKGRDDANVSDQILLTRPTNKIAWDTIKPDLVVFDQFRKFKREQLA